MRKIEYQGEQVEIRRVPVKESIEQSSTFKLEDGSVITLRHLVQDVYRLTEKTDRFGNPIYIVNNQAVVSVVSPDD